MTDLRTFRASDVSQMAKRVDVGGAHRELLADISDRYGWGARGDTAVGPETGPRHWNENEAHALVEVVSLRRHGLTFEQIDMLIEAGPEPILDELASRLAASVEALSAVAATAAA